MITTTLLLALTACMPVHEPNLPPTPSFVGGDETAVLARPISIKAFEEFGVRYWRARYAIVAWNTSNREQPDPQQTVVEWSCDAAPDNGDDVCGALVDRVLPGFGANGRADATLVQLELRYKNASTFDGVELFYAARDGSFRLPGSIEPIKFRSRA